MRIFVTVFALLASCTVERPDLPGFSEIPIEAPAAAYEACASERQDSVRCVLDGDTFGLSSCTDQNAERIRLLGIDAPEIAHEGVAADCYGDIAAETLNDLIGNEDVFLTFGDECEDVYGRTLAWVWYFPEDEDEPILVNEWMLRHGHARQYEGNSDSLLYLERLENAERSAMEGQLGLWEVCGG